MDTVKRHLNIAANVAGSEDPNTIDPSGFQRFCEDLSVDITGVQKSLFAGVDNRLCRSLSLGNWVLKSYFISLEMNGSMA
jgi:hypothetical protein